MLIGRDLAGKPVYKWFQGRTRAELEEARQRVRARYVTGEPSEPDQLFEVYAKAWFEVRKAPHLAPGTRDVYLAALHRRLLPAFGGRNLKAIKPMDVQRFVNGLAGQSETTIHTAMAALRGIFASAVQDQIISTNPTAGLTKPKPEPVKVKRALTPEERARVEETAATHPAGLFLAILYYLGVRSGEARGLKWSDVDWTHARIHVERDVDKAAGDTEGELKTPGSARTLPIPDPLMSLLRPVRGLPGAYILPGTGPGRPMTANMATRRWAALRAAAGLPEDVTPHWLRHNYATMCREAGLPAEDTMRLMGHTSYQTTLGVYTHDSARRLDQLDTAGRLLFGKSCGKVASARDGDSHK